MSIVIHAPLFQRLVLAIGNSKYATDAFKKDPVNARILEPGWIVRSTFPSQDADALTNTFVTILHNYSPELKGHIQALSTLGMLTTAFIAGFNGSGAVENPNIVDIQELNLQCSNHADTLSWSAAFIDGPDPTLQYIQFVERT